VENISFSLGKEFNKLNLNIVANTEVMEIEVGRFHSTLGYTERSTGREDQGVEVQYQEREVTRIYYPLTSPINRPLGIPPGGRR
jgi:hypothetical protein